DRGVRRSRFRHEQALPRVREGLRRHRVTVGEAVVVRTNVVSPNGRVLIRLPALGPVGDRLEVGIERRQTAPELSDAVAVEIGVEVMARRVSGEVDVVEGLIFVGGAGIGLGRLLVLFLGRFGLSLGGLGFLLGRLVLFLFGLGGFLFLLGLGRLRRRLGGVGGGYIIIIVVITAARRQQRGGRRTRNRGRGNLQEGATIYADTAQPLLEQSNLFLIDLDHKSHDSLSSSGLPVCCE